jgi:MerR family transcriptional regulator, repressor of the yfmOP operon
MTTTASKPLRIGEVAELTATTPRTIRYYEEIGLLPGANDRAHGRHRIYSEADVERVREIIRLRDLLGLSLDQLAVLLDAETARSALRRELEHAEDPSKVRGILEQALGHIGTQLELVRMRHQALGQLEEELVAKRRRIHKRLSELPEE